MRLFQLVILFGQLFHIHLPDLLTVIIQVVVGLGIYLTGSAILELDTFEYFKDVLAPSIRQKLKR